MKHVPISKEGLLEILDDIRREVEADDSFEGSIEYLMPEPLGIETKEPFAIRASYRVGNSEGQGGCVLIGGTE